MQTTVPLNKLLCLFGTVPNLKNELLKNGFAEDELDVMSNIGADPECVLFSPNALFKAQLDHNAEIKPFICVDSEEEKGAVLNRISKLFEAMKQMHCGICGLPGHH